VIVFVSLWSADLLALGASVDAVDAEADGYHVDVMDGHMVDDLLFGPAIVSSIRERTRRTLEVHLMVDAADRWVPRFADAGADLITVHASSCHDVRRTLRSIRVAGCNAGLAIGVDEPVDAVLPYIDEVDRVLLMGTALGIKGVSIETATYERLPEAAARCRRAARQPSLIVDGGIRTDAIPRLAAAGAQGVVAGSLVYGQARPLDAIRWLHAQEPTVR
jgi:ribulose-phosphate 3-epimerase